MIEDMGAFGSTTPPPLPPGEQPVASKSRSKARGVAAGVGVALVVAAGGGAVAASGSTPTTSPGGTPPSEGAPPMGEGPQAGHAFGGGRGPGGFGGLGGGLGAGVLHGTFVVNKSGGGYETEQVQTGTVAAVSATSIQITSKDGFKATYVVPSGAIIGAQRDGIGSVKKGDEVTVTATVSGSTATLSRLLDTTELKAGGGTFLGGPEGGFAGRGPGQRGPKTGSSATPTAPPTTS